MRTIRDARHPLVQRAARALKCVNDRHPWSHNDHFHGWILRNLPARRRNALDVGCGRGLLLERLAARFDHVHGTDRDAEMRALAGERCAHLRNVTVDAARLADLDGPFDVITMVAVLHHLEVVDAVRQVRRLLAPGGHFLVVGLAPPVTFADHGWDIASAITNPIIGFARHPKVADPPGEPPFPVAEPTLSLGELANLLDELMPGARIRRRLAFRHTIRWRAPATPVSPGSAAAKRR